MQRLSQDTVFPKRLVVCAGRDIYYLYKMKYTLNVQGICDFEGMFIYVYRRWPGSVHGAKVFSNSRINCMIGDGILPLLHRSLLPGVDKVPVLLLGDPA